MAAAETPSKYAVLAPDSRGHCSWFLSRTNTEHRTSMEHPFMKSIYARTFDKEAYVQYLVGQYHVFSQMEAMSTAHRDEVPISAVYDQALHRGDAILSDLKFWAGDRWQAAPDAATISAATARYLEQLHKDAADPWLLLCHHFLQYNAALSGGQFLGRMVSERAGADGIGAAFYRFPLKGKKPHGRVQEYIEAVDQLTISAEKRDQMVVCMRQVYALLFAQFDEAYALAPVDGISFEQGKAAVAANTAGSSEASGGAAAKKSASTSVPPPLEPGSKKFTLKQLRGYNGEVDGQPIMTSLLGRVYDVTSGKDLFGPGGPYEMFAGHDGTYNLGVMSLKKNTLDKFKYKMDAEDHMTLAEWLAYFDNRYGQPVGMLSDKTHPIKVADLPLAKKIPFSNSSASGAAPASKL
eukprot:gnl/TRDRNA2_/TRDRNA2_30636_c0_seq1.p1 gnl/TRDRNA2_/TRDRNA2_30636_c0~~gnl/TRDRNA2_/TRDRNA2_30636_c0_seq1.p1  ORF type:complete len:408 (+),score=77.70 gnl/TRDRNA2_/TRDRNA2_30636_c0_seq1:67-1290(+)